PGGAQPGGRSVDLLVHGQPRHRGDALHRQLRRAPGERGPAAPVGGGERRVSGRRAAVLGHPISHSLSPVLHRAAYQALGLDDWSYDAVDVTEEELGAFAATLDHSWAGLSLTMPLKKTVLGLLDH